MTWCQWFHWDGVDILTKPRLLHTHRPNLSGAYEYSETGVHLLLSCNATLVRLLPMVSKVFNGVMISSFPITCTLMCSYTTRSSPFKVYAAGIIKMAGEETVLRNMYVRTYRPARFIRIKQTLSAFMHTQMPIGVVR